MTFKRNIVSGFEWPKCQPVGFTTYLTSTTEEIFTTLHGRTNASGGIDYRMTGTTSEGFGADTGWMTETTVNGEPFTARQQVLNWFELRTDQDIALYAMNQIESVSQNYF